jgi:hypothetical protein
MDVRLQRKNAIEQAERIGGDKLKIIIKPLTMTLSPNGTVPPFLMKSQEIILEKVGAKLHVLSNRFVDGTRTLIEDGKALNGSGAPTPFIERCDPAN